jgi:hypothetical protein
MHASGLFLDQLVFSCKFSRLIDRTTILCTHLNSVRGKKIDRAPGAHLLGQLLVPRVDSLDACLQVPKTEMSRASWTYLLVMDFFWGTEPTCQSNILSSTWACRTRAELYKQKVG